MAALFVAQWLLLILAERALRTFEKYKQLPAILAYEQTLVPAAQSYIESYGTLQTHAATKTLALAQGRASVQKLYSGLLSWLGMVVRDIPGFALDPALKVEHPDRVIAFAEQLLLAVQAHAERLRFAPGLIQEVTALLNTARTDWEAAQLALGEHQALQATVRERGVALNRELVAFRRTARNVLGPSNRDVRLLRSARDQAADSEAEEQPADATGATTQTAQPATMPTTQPATTPAVQPATTPAPTNGSPARASVPPSPQS